MKTLLLTVTVAIGLVSGSCGATRSETNSESPREQTPGTKQTVVVMPVPANIDEYKKLLFLDQRLEELTTRHNLPNDPFAKAYQQVKEGKTADAKKSLRQVLSDPAAEVREKLWAWRALRQLGEKPPPNVANEIQGVVIEVPVDDWIDTLGAYSDGRARYLNPKGGLIVWEAMEKNELSTLAKSFINAAKPLVDRAPLSDEHQPAKEGVVRVTILTYAGIRVLEGKDSDVMEGSHILSPVARAGQVLFISMLEAAEKQKR